jgi:hypothetical protein
MGAANPARMMNDIAAVRAIKSLRRRGNPAGDMTGSDTRVKSSQFTVSPGANLPPAILIGHLMIITELRARRTTSRGTLLTNIR